MTFHIQWSEEADNELAAVWLASANRNDVTVASRQLEKALAIAPLQLGESRTSSVHRVACFLPIYVEYDVVVDDLKVIVLGLALLE